MSLKELIVSLQHQIERTLKQCRDLEDPDIANVLDDMLLRQKFWAEDLNLANPTLSLIVPEDVRIRESTERLKIIKEQLQEVRESITAGSTEGLLAIAEGLRNDHCDLCDEIEIFELLESFEASKAGLDPRRPDKTLSQLLRGPTEPEYRVLPLQVIDEHMLFNPPARKGPVTVTRLPIFGEIRRLYLGALSSWRERAGAVQILAFNDHGKSILEYLIIRSTIELSLHYKTVRLSMHLAIFAIQILRLDLWVHQLLVSCEDAKSQCDVATSFEKLTVSGLSILNSQLKNFLLSSHYEIIFPNLRSTIEDISAVDASSTGSPSQSNMTTSDLIKFMERIEDLAEHVGTLENLGSSLDRESLRRKLRLRIAAVDTEELHHVQDGARLLDYIDIVSIIDALTSGAEGELEKLDPSSIDEISHVDWQPHFQPSIATIHHREVVLIDWLSPQTVSPVTIRQWRLSEKSFLGGLMASCLRPIGVSVLECVGYVENRLDSRGSLDMRGLVYHVPSESAGSRPFSLDHALDADLLTETLWHKLDPPDLGQRFDIAKSLVKTVFGLHTIGFIQAELSSKRILLWARRSLEGGTNYGRPYLIGCSDTRYFPTRDKVWYDLISPFLSLKIRKRQDYATNVYFLGIILLEIGFCCSIAFLYKRSVLSGGDGELVDLISEDQIKLLRSKMGSRYTECTLACLDNRFSNILDKYKDNKEMQQQEYLKLFQADVVDKIAMLNA